MNFLGIPTHSPSIQPSVVFHIGSFPVSSSFLMICLVLLLVLVGIFILKKYIRAVPGVAQNLFELLMEGMYKLIDQITRNREVTEKIFPLIASLFIFIGVSNIISLVPGLTSITFKHKELLRSPTSDFNTTLALATAMVLLVQWRGLRDWGFFGYLGKFVQVKEVWHGFRKGIGAGSIAVINFFIGLLDIISELAKIISLSMRLFGNIYAGEILMTVILGGLAYGLPAVWVGMSLFVGIIQALVFGSLVAAYYTLVKKPEGNNS